MNNLQNYANLFWLLNRKRIFIPAIAHILFITLSTFFVVFFVDTENAKKISQLKALGYYISPYFILIQITYIFDHIQKYQTILFLLPLNKTIQYLFNQISLILIAFSLLIIGLFFYKIYELIITTYFNINIQYNLTKIVEINTFISILIISTNSLNKNIKKLPIDFNLLIFSCLGYIAFHFFALVAFNDENSFFQLFTKNQLYMILLGIFIMSQIINLKFNLKQEIK